MKLIVFGASRGVGRLLTEQALEQGHQVTAFARNPASLNLQHASLNVFAGDVTDPVGVERSLIGQEMVFLTVGADKNRGATTLFSVAARNITQAMNAQGVRRLVFLANYALFSEKVSGFRTAGLVWAAKLFMRGILQDQRRAVDEIQKYDREWIVVRPMPFTNGPRTGHYRVALEGLPEGGTNISRADVADFMLKQVSDNEYVHKLPGLAY